MHRRPLVTIVHEQKITYLVFGSIKVPIWALNLTWWYSNMSADSTYDSLYMVSPLVHIIEWATKLGVSPGRHPVGKAPPLLSYSYFHLCDSRAIPSSQPANCFYTDPLVELPCPCILVHIVYLFHINLKKRKKGATAEVTLPYLEPSVTGFLIR